MNATTITAVHRTADPVAGPPVPRAVFTSPSPARFVADQQDAHGRPARHESSSMAELMLRTAEARLRGPVAPPPCPPQPPLTLLVVRTSHTSCAEQDARLLTAQLAVAAHGLPFEGRVLQDAGAPVRWPDAFGASRVPVPGARDALLWSPPDAPEVLVLAGLCPGDRRWSDTVTRVLVSEGPARLAVPALHALGRDACDVARVLRRVPALLVHGLLLDAAVHGPFLDLMSTPSRPPVAGPTARRRHVRRHCPKRTRATA